MGLGGGVGEGWDGTLDCKCTVMAVIWELRCGGGEDFRLR